MNIKHQEIDIPKEDPFKNCKLERKKYGEILTEIISTYSDGFVLGIDNKWGTGKTTFVRMWEQHLQNQEFKTLYFNAWINDFDNNPLIAILSELKTISSDKKERDFKSLLTKGAVITKNVLPGIAKAIAKRYIDTEALSDAIEEMTKSAVEVLKDDIDEYAKKKQGLLDFKSELEKFVKNHTDNKPLVFIVDELDRCRPSYAVEILEQIKHFFSVKGIVFVLSIDKIQLGNAVRGFYGSDLINADEYLRRFIDIEYNIPEPSTKLFTNYLYDYYQFNDFFSGERSKHGEFRDDKEEFLKMANLLFLKDSTPLRQQDKVFAHARIVLNLFQSNYYIHVNVFFTLVYLRDINKELYFEIRERKLSPQELINKINPIIKAGIDRVDLRASIYLEARIVQYYNNYYKEINYSSQIMERDQASPAYILLINSGFGKDKNDDLNQALTYLQNSRQSDTSLSYLLNKIDLLENMPI